MTTPLAHVFYWDNRPVVGFVDMDDREVVSINLILARELHWRLFVRRYHVVVCAKVLEFEAWMQPPTPQQRREAMAAEIATWVQEQLNYIQGGIILEGAYADYLFTRMQRKGLVWVTSHRHPTDNFPFFVNTSVGVHQPMYYVVEQDLSIRHPLDFPRLSHVYNSFRNQLTVVQNYQNWRSNRR